MFHADGRTDTTKLLTAFRNCFLNAPKISPVRFLFLRLLVAASIISVARIQGNPPEANLDQRRERRKADQYA